MTTNDEDRPGEWKEREEAGAFVAWIMPRAGALKEVAIAAVVTVVAIAHPFVFDFVKPEVRLLGTAAPALLAMALWYNAVVALQPRATFRVEGGRLTLGKPPLPALRTVALSLAELVAVRPVGRAVKGKHLDYELWDLVVDMRDGASHVVKLSWVGPKKAAWMARRLSEAAGV